MGQVQESNRARLSASREKVLSQLVAHACTDHLDIPCTPYIANWLSATIMYAI